MAQQAQDTFTVQLADGSSMRVAKGEVFADGHEVVKLDDGRGVLFKPLDFGEGEKRPAKSGPDPEKEAEPVKPAAKPRVSPAGKS
jgi:hypothetical protein